jgi:hypothetical protein
MRGELKAFLIALGGACVLAYLIGPVNWYLVHGPSPIVSSKIIWKIIMVLPVVPAGVVGFVSSDGVVAGLIQMLAFFCVYLLCGFARITFFVDSDIGWILPSTLSALFMAPGTIVGVFLGTKIREKRKA